MCRESLPGTEPPAQQLLNAQLVDRLDFHFVSVGHVKTKTMTVSVGFHQLLVIGHQGGSGSVFDGGELSHQDTVSPQGV